MGMANWGGTLQPCTKLIGPTKRAPAERQNSSREGQGGQHSCSSSGGGSSAVSFPKGGKPFEAALVVVRRCILIPPGIYSS